jgi:hypothetical protein
MNMYFQAIRALISGGAGSLSYTGTVCSVLIIYILDWGCIQLLALLLFLPLFGRPYQAVFAGQMSLCVELAP